VLQRAKSGPDISEKYNEERICVQSNARTAQVVGCSNYPSISNGSSEKKSPVLLDAEFGCYPAPPPVKSMMHAHGLFRPADVYEPNTLSRIGQSKRFCTPFIGIQARDGHEFH
jgi:hypothetical protein